MFNTFAGGVKGTHSRLLIVSAQSHIKYLIRFPHQFSFKMLGGNTIFHVLILLQTIKANAKDNDISSCRLSSESPSPEVTPWNSNAIKVSWDKVFIGCKNQDIKNLEVKVENQMNAATEDYAKIVEV